MASSPQKNLQFISPPKKAGDFLQNQVKVSTGMVLTKLIVIAVLGAVMIPYWNLANVGAFPNMNDFGAVNAVYASFFKKTLPARSCVEIGKLPMNGDVEVEVVAYCK